MSCVAEKGETKKDGLTGKPTSKGGVFTSRCTYQLREREGVTGVIGGPQEVEGGAWRKGSKIRGRQSKRTHH